MRCGEGVVAAFKIILFIHYSRTSKTTFYQGQHIQLSNISYLTHIVYAYTVCNTIQLC